MDVPAGETSYVCEECLHLFTTMTEFEEHCCIHSKTEGSEAKLEVNPESEEKIVHIKLEDLEEIQSESDVETETSVINIEPASSDLESNSIFGDKSSYPLSVHIVNHDDLDIGMKGHSTLGGTSRCLSDIPTASVYLYDNPIYLNRLMKDNTFGKRMRPDALYSEKLGPWDDKSSFLLISLVAQNPHSYFILDKECKRTEVWEVIRSLLYQEGYQFTVLQIRMRWRELVKTYRATINENELYGLKLACQYFDELNQLFGIWDYTATLKLIDQLGVIGLRRLGQNGGTRMRLKVWESIQQSLASEGYEYTPDQVQGRWNTLVTLYQRMVEYNSKEHNEEMTIAYHKEIESVYVYTPERTTKWLKAMNRRGLNPQKMNKKWSWHCEDILLQSYLSRISRFCDKANNDIVWHEIADVLKEEANFSVTPMEVNKRMKALAKQFEVAEQHNAQPGTIRRESRHHQLLSQIYETGGCWPHDNSVVKLDKPNTKRIRMVNAQLMWQDDQSRSLLRLYPEALKSHLRAAIPQPKEELWVELAKLYAIKCRDKRNPYEIEEHIGVLRWGYNSENPFPFVSEMSAIEKVERSLNYTPMVIICGSMEYWSHTATQMMLNFVIEGRMENIGRGLCNIFENISQQLEESGYRYSPEEVRRHFTQLRQMYLNRARSMRLNKGVNKPFPYMEKMAQLDRQAEIMEKSSVNSEIDGDFTCLPVKRGRGRPRGSFKGSKEGEVIKTINVNVKKGNATEEEGKIVKRRGRPRKHWRREDGESGCENDIHVRGNVSQYVQVNMKRCHGVKMDSGGGGKGNDVTMITQAIGGGTESKVDVSDKCNKSSNTTMMSRKKRKFSEMTDDKVSVDVLTMEADCINGDQVVTFCDKVDGQFFKVVYPSTHTLPSSTQCIMLPREMVQFSKNVRRDEISDGEEDGDQCPMVNMLKDFYEKCADERSRLAQMVQMSHRKQQTTLNSIIHIISDIKYRLKQ